MGNFKLLIFLTAFVVCLSCPVESFPGGTEEPVTISPSNPVIEWDGIQTFEVNFKEDIGERDYFYSWSVRPDTYCTVISEFEGRTFTVQGNNTTESKVVTTIRVVVFNDTEQMSAETSLYIRPESSSGSGPP